MHALLIHQAFAGPNDPGGTRHFELGRDVVSRGHQFTVVASPISYLTGQQTGTGAAVEPEEQYSGVRVLRSYVYRSLHRSFVWRVVSFLSFMFSSVWTARRAGPVDVVMGTSPPIFQAFSALGVAMIRRVPFLLEVRDLWPAFAVDMGVLKAPFLIKASEFLEGFLYRRATHILVNSPAYREHVIASGIAPDKVSFISNGVDTDMFDPDATGARLRTAWQASDKFVVTYAGALGAANDIDTLLRAADRLGHRPEIQFVLVGDGKERPRLERLSAEMRLTNVLFAGTKSKAEMPEVLAASNACLAILQNIRMFKTTYPNKVFDYMAAGRPTILAIDGVIRAVIETSGGGLFVPPGDDAALAEAVAALSADRARALAMGRAARAHVVRHFNRRDQAQQFAELLERMAS